jgi:hypothetical protein
MLTLQPQQQDNNKDHCNATLWLTPQSLDPLWSPSSGQSKPNGGFDDADCVLHAPVSEPGCIRASQLLLENTAWTLPHRLINSHVGRTLLSSSRIKRHAVTDKRYTMTSYIKLHNDNGSQQHFVLDNRDAPLDLDIKRKYVFKAKIQNS